MDEEIPSGNGSREGPNHTYDLSGAIYGKFPSCATSSTVHRSRAGSPAKPTGNRRRSANVVSPPSLSINPSQSTTTSSWLPQSKRSRLQTYHMELHQSTCLNLNLASGDMNTESDLWILPDFDDWEIESDAHSPPQIKPAEWGPLLRRAANSNLERLRARLEGDGWAFVGGKYGEEQKTLKESISQSEGSVDEEFDVVVLPAATISC